MKNTNHLKVVQVLRCVGMVTLLFALRPVWAAGVFVDPLDAPALKYATFSDKPLLSVVSAGERLVAVGSRGLIIFSDNNGKTWSQARVPVQSDLLSVDFPNPMDGWAVGHSGVILHSSDGGKSWKKQLDGREAEHKFEAYYKALGPKGAGPLKELKLNFRAGPALPYLDVWFENAQRGYVVGSFGMIASTNDGGKSWQPWLHRIDNPQALHLNAIREIGHDLYIAGERGQVFRLDQKDGYFHAMKTGYRGSFFGIAGNANTLIAYGLRGTVYRSSDRGKTWEPVAMPTKQTLVAAIPAGKAHDQFYLLSSGGEIIRLGGRGSNAVEVKNIKVARRATDIVMSENGQLVLTGLGGVRQISLHDSLSDLSTTAAQQ